MMRHREQRPGPDENDGFYGRYIDRVPDGDIADTLDTAAQQTLVLLHGLDEQHGAHRYAPGKWSIKQVVGHVADSERILVYRALRIARGDTTPLPGFDEDAYAAASGADDRSLAELTAEFAAVRQATSRFVRGLGPDAWLRRGVANDAPISVRALAWIVAGHELHHHAVLSERYLPGLRSDGAVAMPDTG